MTLILLPPHVAPKILQRLADNAVADVCEAVLVAEVLEKLDPNFTTAVLQSALAKQDPNGRN